MGAISSMAESKGVWHSTLSKASLCRLSRLALSKGAIRLSRLLCEGYFAVEDRAVLHELVRMHAAYGDQEGLWQYIQCIPAKVETSGVAV